MEQEYKICMNILSYRCDCNTALIQCFAVTSGVHSLPHGIVTIQYHDSFVRVSFCTAANKRSGDTSVRTVEVWRYNSVQPNYVGNILKSKCLYF